MDATNVQTNAVHTRKNSLVQHGDNSRLAEVCSQWGSTLDGKWGHASFLDESRLYNHAAFVASNYNIPRKINPRLECDDISVGVSPGDFWKVFVR